MPVSCVRWDDPEWKASTYSCCGEKYNKVSCGESLIMTKYVQEKMGGEPGREERRDLPGSIIFLCG